MGPCRDRRNPYQRAWERRKRHLPATGCARSARENKPSVHEGQDNRTNIPKRDGRLRSELTQHPLGVHNAFVRKKATSTKKKSASHSHARSACRSWGRTQAILRNKVGSTKRF